MPISTTDELDCCIAVVSAAKRLNSHKLESYAEVVQSAIPKWNAFVSQQKKLNRNQGHLFNPLDFFKIGETKHSFLLRYLLDPEADHGQGDLFLLSFLNKIGIPTPAEGKWIVPPCEHMDIDILLFRQNPSSVVIIENKSHDAVDQANQLYRYWYNAIHAQHPQLDYTSRNTHDHFKIIYLPSGDHKHYTEQSVTLPDYEPYASIPNLPLKLPLPIDHLTFRHFISEWLHEITTNVPKQNTRLITYLDFYKELCQSL